MDFEKSLKRLEGISKLLETDNISLEDSLKLFEEGITLSRSCSETLKKANQRILSLTDAESEVNADD